MLLHRLINVLSRPGPYHGFENLSGNGRFGLYQGQLPHVSDGIHLSDSSWMNVQRLTILKCWLKELILAQIPVTAINEMIKELNGVVIDVKYPSIVREVVEEAISDLEEPLEPHQVAEISRDWTTLQTAVS